MSDELEALYDNLDIFSGRRWRQNLLADIMPFTEPATARPLLSVLREAQRQGCQTVVRERDYVDADYLDEFQHHYCVAFGNPEAKCERLHFFRARLGRADLLDLTAHTDSYLGYSVLRPTRSFRTGRTAISPGRQHPDKGYVLCRSEFHANLSGTTLTVRAAPFMQADSNVGVCAQASLWSAARYMHQEHGFPLFVPSRITEAATRAVTIGQVREGLADLQVLAALREMGFSPQKFTHYSTETTARIIYGYVESAIPVILGLKIGNEGHAVVVVGHDFHVRKTPRKAWDSNIHWIDNFIVSDHASGPYDTLPIRRHDRHGISIAKNVTRVYIPHPPEVTVRLDDVTRHVQTIMTRLNQIIALFPEADALAFTQDELESAVFRTYLRRSNEFKTTLPAGMSDFFKHVYKSMRMPKYIWVTEISTAAYINQPRSSDRKAVGEIVIDSTADWHWRLGSFLAIHLNGRMILRDPQRRLPWRLYVDPADMPYGHLVRMP